MSSVWLSDSQDQKLLTHRWWSFPGLVNKRVPILFAYTNCKYNHFGRMWLCSCLFAENVSLKIVDAQLTLNLMIYWQSVGAQQLYVKMHIVVIGSQWIISMYKHLHPNASKPLNFWSSTWHIIWVINDVGPSHSSAFGWQLTAYTSVHSFLIYLALLPHLLSCSSFSAISITYHKQFSTSRLCAPGLCSELCSWIHDRMQQNGRHSFNFVLRFDRCIYDDITDLYFVSEFRL